MKPVVTTEADVSTLKIGDTVYNVSFLNYSDDTLCNHGGYELRKFTVEKITPKKVHFTVQRVTFNSLNPSSSSVNEGSSSSNKEDVSEIKAMTNVDLITLLEAKHKAILECNKNSDFLKDYVRKCYAEINFEALKNF